mmetsp:Transcript_35242/g.101358  ORF Transcript_35242/g.101358 Transcript_35242/m.101358 type:complete len:114 (-) Transcript_35242:2653-2994(-)
MESTADNPSPQAVLAKACVLHDAIRTREAYDHTMKQREPVDADIAVVMTGICHLIASASDPQLQVDATQQLVRLLSVEHIDSIAQKAIEAGSVPVLVGNLTCEEAPLCHVCQS